MKIEFDFKFREIGRSLAVMIVLILVGMTLARWAMTPVERPGTATYRPGIVNLDPRIVNIQEEANGKR